MNCSFVAALHTGLEKRNYSQFLSMRRGEGSGTWIYPVNCRLINFSYQVVVVFFAWKEHAATQRNFAAVWQIYPLISDCVTSAHHRITGFLQTAERDSWLTPALWLTCFTAETFKNGTFSAMTSLECTFLPSSQEQEQSGASWQPATSLCVCANHFRLN